MVRCFRVMEKKLTNSGPFMKSTGKHSIYTLQRNALRAVEGGGSSASCSARTRTSCRGFRPRTSTAASTSTITSATPARSSTARSRQDRTPRERGRHDLDETIQAQLGKTLDKTRFPELGDKYEGKVRDCYMRDGRRTLIVVTDRISAFDVVLGTIPFKGQVLNRMAAFWFEATADLAPNHVINVPDPTVTVARECKPLPVEFVMRAYLTGVTTTSIWTHYERGARSSAATSSPRG